MSSSLLSNVKMANLFSVGPWLKCGWQFFYIASSQRMFRRVAFSLARTTFWSFNSFYSIYDQFLSFFTSRSLSHDLLRPTLEVAIQMRAKKSLVQLFNGRSKFEAPLNTFHRSATGRLENMPKGVVVSNCSQCSAGVLKVYYFYT
jgi:hypothetical protein